MDELEAHGSLLGDALHDILRLHPAQLMLYAGAPPSI